MKKVSISTFCVWNSFGSVLQAIGLQKKIAELGVDVRTIVFESENVPAIKYHKDVKGIIRNIFLIRHRKELERARINSNKFIEDNVKVIKYPTIDEIMENPPISDVYLAGSDQIWHPAVCREDFFLKYVKNTKRKIAYAASMGVLDIPEENQSKFDEYIKNFDAYSVRERSMVPLIEPLVDKEVNVHIDPTFLVKADDWRSLEKAYPIEEPYILVYAIHWENKFNQQLKLLHDTTGIPIVSIQSNYRRIYSNKIVCDADPAQFLWLVDHAEAVITSSFHGTAFSIIFNKMFAVVNNQNASSRIGDLLDILDITVPEVRSVFDSFNVDYSDVNARINSECDRSTDYLRGEIYEK